MKVVLRSDSVDGSSIGAGFMNRFSLLFNLLFILLGFLSRSGFSSIVNRG